MSQTGERAQADYEFTKTEFEKNEMEYSGLGDTSIQRVYDDESNFENSSRSLAKSAETNQFDK